MSLLQVYQYRSGRNRWCLSLPRVFSSLFGADFRAQLGFVPSRLDAQVSLHTESTSRVSDDAEMERGRRCRLT